MCYQSSGSFSVIWNRGDAHRSHSSLNSELSQFIVLKLIWPSRGTFQHRQLTSSAGTSAPTFAANFECASLIFGRWIRNKVKGEGLDSLLSSEARPYRQGRAGVNRPYHGQKVLRTIIPVAADNGQKKLNGL